MTEITKEQANAAVSSNEQVFDAAGLTDEYMAKKLKALTGAMETKVFHDKDASSHEPIKCPKCQDGLVNGKKCKLCKGTGFMQISSVVYSKNLKAQDIRLKALELTYKLKGKVPAEKHELGGPGGKPLIVEVVKFGDENTK